MINMDNTDNIQLASDFLREHNEGVLATVRYPSVGSADSATSQPSARNATGISLPNQGEQPRPCLRAFQVMKQVDGTLYFATAPQKEVYRQLQVNPAVEFMVLHGKVSVRCAGTARFDVDDETCRWIYDNNPVLPRLYSSYDKLVYFRVPVERLEYFDLCPTPPVVLHIDLATKESTIGFCGERFMA